MHLPSFSTLHDVRRLHLLRRVARIARRSEGNAISVATVLKRLGRAATNSLLPSRCLACDAQPVEELFRGGVCNACWRALPCPAGSRCETCDEPLAAADAGSCGRCILDPPAFRSMRAAAPYRGSARSILLAFKFRGADYLGPHIADVVIARLGAPSFPDEVAAVPATARSIRRRGYHPAQVLAEAVARRLGVGYAAGRLKKERETARQSGLALDRRRTNVRGAFRASGAAPNVLLVDDVATSGWTARECARALADAGAQDVDVWCFARASRDDVDSGDGFSGSLPPR